MQNPKSRNLNSWLSNKRKNIPDGLWAKCCECGEIIYNGELDRNLRICPKCNYHFPLDPVGRMNLLADEGSLTRYDDVECPDNEKCDRTIITGEAKLSGHRLVLMSLNLNFTKYETGLFVCEKIVNAVERAVEKRLPFLSVCTSSGETQIYNGTFFPSQMLSVSVAMSKLIKERLLYISVLSQSDSHDNFPGFAYAGDIVIAESNTLGTSPTGSRIGRREADRATEMLFQSSVVDMIVPRRELKEKLTEIIKFFK